MTVILVVEDDPRVCDLLSEIMEAELAAVVRCAQTGGLALEAIQTAGFDLAIIDVNMPEMSGYELAQWAANWNIPTLLCSGHPNAKARLNEFDCPHLAKPFGIHELVYKAANAITHAAENIRRIKTALAKLQTTTEGLRADLTSTWLTNDSKAIFVARPSLGSVHPQAKAESPPKAAIPPDVLGERVV